jgi:hypothetical protein
MEVNIIQKIDFGSAPSFSRLDAEFVWKSRWDIEKAVRAVGGRHLADLVRKYDGPTLNDGFCGEDKIVKYVDIDSIDTSDGLAYADELLYGDRPSRAKYQIEEGDILVSNVRPNRGAVTFVGAHRSGAIASSGFSLLRDKELEGASQQYLFAFLKSSFGRIQIKRRCRGSMYPAISPDDLLDVWVPEPPDNVLRPVCEAVKRGVSFQTEFFQLIEKQAEMLEEFLAPFGHPPSPLEGDITKANWTEIEKADVDRAQRFDAEFFRNEYQTFDKKLQSLIQTFLLGDYFNLSPGRGLAKSIETAPFIKQGVLTNAGVNWSAVSYPQGRPKSSGDVKTGDVILACTAHEVYYVGRKVDFVREVPDEMKVNAAVADLMVIRPRPGRPEGIFGSFIAAFLRSPSGLHQVQRCIRGLRGGHVYKDDLSRYVRVPLPKQSWLDAFEARAAEYESVRSQAKREIGDACAIVEKWLSAVVL